MSPTVYLAPFERMVTEGGVDDHAWRTEPGTYRVHVGSSVADLTSPLDLTL
jgi:hypothetical protein